MEEKIFMNDEKNKDKPLIIPENCPPVDYFIMGFTKLDSGIITLSGIIGAFIGITIYARNGNSILGVAVLFLFVVAAITILRRDANTENLIDKIRIVREYKRVQKIYLYEYVNIWEIERKKCDAASRGKAIG